MVAAAVSVLLHAVCFQLRAAAISAATVALRDCPGGNVRACVQDGSCARAARVAGTHCFAWTLCRVGVRVCAKMCRELCGVGRVGGVRPRGAFACALERRGTPEAAGRDTPLTRPSVRFPLIAHSGWRSGT